MTVDEKRERLNYIRFRIKVVSLAAMFIHYQRLEVQETTQKKMTKTHMKLIVEYKKDENFKENESDLLDLLITVWFIVISFFLWFNLVTSPFVWLYPELQENKQFYYALWLNELVWILDIIRKIFHKPKKSRARDSYENALIYIKSTLILDVVAGLP